MNAFTEIRNFVWGIPLLCLILGCGGYLTVYTDACQLRLFPEAVGSFCRRLRKRGGLTELCTALAATVGTGNIVGVAGALCIGGPGAIFWMWVSAFFGMAVKFSEVSLAVQFRTKEAGILRGGPMYMISRGMGKGFLPMARLYCLLGIFACLGMGTSAQISAVLVTLGENERMKAPLCLLFAAILGFALWGGGKRIGKLSEILVPASSLAYILLCAGVLLRCHSRLPEAFLQILRGAFVPRAVTGGMVGSALVSLRCGCSRGIFSNEAGMGTASIAHASADVKSPAEQGLMGIMEVFLDTHVICTLTALAILSSGVPIPYGREDGGSLTAQALTAILGPWSGKALGVCLSCFAFATVLGWGLYGLRCWEFLFGTKNTGLFLGLQIATVVLSGIVQSKTIWLFSEIVNGLMAIPNLVALVALSPCLKCEEETGETGEESVK